VAKATVPKTLIVLLIGIKADFRNYEDGDAPFVKVTRSMESKRSPAGMTQTKLDPIVMDGTAAETVREKEMEEGIRKAGRPRRFHGATRLTSKFTSKFNSKLPMEAAR
jgi:hypothetical protein